MRTLFSLALSVTMVSGSLLANESEKLFQLGGKTYTTKDLSPVNQQAVYEIHHQAYENLKKVVDAQVLEHYAHSEAKKKGMPLDKFEEQLFHVKTISDGEAKKWYDENKARVGNREFDPIKNDIKQFLQNQEMEKQRTALVSKIKLEGKFHFAALEPEAPVMEIASQGYPTKGSEKARVRIVEFADYRCHHCRDASTVLKSLVNKYKDKVQFVYMDFPLDRNGVSKKLAEGGVCADKQKKFWDYHYMAFADAGLSDKSPTEFATKLKLDMKAFEQCMNSPEASKHVDASRSEGERVGVDGTPTIFFNGRKILGHNEQALEEALKKLL